MSNEFLEIGLDSYGMTFSTAPVYFSLSWGAILTILAIVIGRKVYKYRKGM